MQSARDVIEHAKNVTKWKVDQQASLWKVQQQIGKIENDIRGKKSELAETALALYAKENLLEDELKQICSAINQLYDQVKFQQGVYENINRQRPPERNIYDPSIPQPPASNLICPQCGKTVVGSFCPEHGIAGISPTYTTNLPDATSGIEIEPGGKVICPICRQVLSVKFCPEHGVEGIPG